MGRPAVHPWRQYLTREEKQELAKNELQQKELSCKIKALKIARQLLRMRGSKRAIRDASA